MALHPANRMLRSYDAQGEPLVLARNIADRKRCKRREPVRQLRFARRIEALGRDAEKTADRAGRNQPPAGKVCTASP
jgi:hypothetical protein